MRNLKTIVMDRNDFENFVYEEKSDANFFYKENGINTWIEFGGGLFYCTYEESDYDMDGFQIGRPIIKKICTIECVRRKLLEVMDEGKGLNEMDQWEVNSLIAKIVFENGV